MAKDSGIKVKVGIVGPCEAGKTTLANFLADATEAVIEDYNPTHVVRVLEFDSVCIITTNIIILKALEATFLCNIYFVFLDNFNQQQKFQG